ncbi:MAG: LysM peptidoglycan-binding domain-containing protein [Tenericutes bacterium]|nr:LysM peptidoglycan-binding domain-containing protein [Bacilli bacterium]NLV90555.1 LysM peptidoglycan-binding domain-containing protein [Mycoplasmatota bacterium]
MSKNKLLSLTITSLILLGSYNNTNALEIYTPRPTIFHEVKKGDTFIKIAEKYFKDGSLYDELAEYNQRYPDYIYIGEHILVPDKQILLGNIQDIDHYGCTPVDAENPKDLNWKFYQMKEGDTFNGTYYTWYKEIFEEKPEIANEFTHVDLRTGLYIFNSIEDEYNMQIGTKIYLMDYDNLILYTRNLKETNKLTKKR